MSILYTHRGFPVDVITEQDSIYESPAVTQVWQSFRTPTKPSTAEILMSIAVLKNEWDTQGGMFKAVLNPNIRIASIVQSFVSETALLLTDRITRRKVGFNDWGLMLTSVTGSLTYPATFTADERSAIEWLTQLDQNLLFAKWLRNEHGINDLVETMQLFVGTRDPFGR